MSSTNFQSASEELLYSNNKRFIAIQTTLLMLGMVVLAVVGISINVQTKPDDVLRSQQMHFKAIEKDLVAIHRELDDLSASTTSLTLIYEMSMAESQASFVVLDRHGMIRTWSNGAEDMFGVSSANAIGRVPSFFMTDGEFDIHQPAYEARMNKKGQFNHVVRCDCVTADGTVIPVTIRMRVLPGHGAVALIEQREN